MRARGSFVRGGRDRGRGRDHSLRKALLVGARRCNCDRDFDGCEKESSECEQSGNEYLFQMGSHI